MIPPLILIQYNCRNWSTQVTEANRSTSMSTPKQLIEVILSCSDVLIEATLLASVTYLDQLQQLYFINIGGGFICF